MQPAGQEGYMGYMQPVGITPPQPQGMYIHPGPNGWCIQQGMVVWNGPGGQMSMYYPHALDAGNQWQQQRPFLIGQPGPVSQLSPSSAGMDISGPTPPSSTPPSLPPLPPSTPPPPKMTDDSRMVNSKWRGGDETIDEASVKTSSGTQTSSKNLPSSSSEGMPSSLKHPDSTIKALSSSTSGTSIHSSSPERSRKENSTSSSVIGNLSSAKTLPPTKCNYVANHTVKSIVAKENSLKPKDHLSSTKSSSSSSEVHYSAKENNTPNATKDRSSKLKTSPTAKLPFTEYLPIRDNHAPSSTKTLFSSNVVSQENPEIVKDCSSVPRTLFPATSSRANPPITHAHCSSTSPKTYSTKVHSKSQENPRITTKDHPSMTRQSLPATSSPSAKNVSVVKEKWPARKIPATIKNVHPSSTTNLPSLNHNTSSSTLTPPIRNCHSSSVEKPLTAKDELSSPKQSSPIEGHSAMAENSSNTCSTPTLPMPSSIKGNSEPSRNHARKSSSSDTKVQCSSPTKPSSSEEHHPSSENPSATRVEPPMKSLLDDPEITEDNKVRHYYHPKQNDGCPYSKDFSFVSSAQNLIRG